MDDRIFISYSHKDAETVKKIAKIIEKASNMPVWFDSSLRGGENYFSVIANQIVECNYFVFIVSDNSIMSDWCLRELEFAASERKIIVAVWLDNVSISPRIKLVIQNTHYVNYYSTTDESFFDAISKTFSNRAIFSRQEISNDPDQDLSWSETYFVEREKINKIESLLTCEKQGEYSVCFQSENACLLGLAYELGIKVEIDLRKAEFYYKVSHHQGNYDGQYLYAAIRRKKDCSENSIIYLPAMIDAAEHQSIYALTYLGDDYYYGRNGCEKDIAKAYEFWEKAAAAGGVVAMYYMAFGHRKGEYVEKDADLSYMYALMATEYGFPRAYRILAFMYEDGDFFGKDYEKAIKMYEEAIKRGDYLSLCYQGWVYGEKGDFDKKRELYEQAFELAEKGKIKSALPYYRMGYIYEYGEGVSKDTIKAVEYYLQAAEKNSDNALKYTVSAIMSIEDATLMESFLKRAYELGCQNAAYELGNIEATKCGSERLSDAAVRYYIKGAEDGDIQCVIKLLHNYSFIIGCGKDRDDRLNAIKWFQFLFANADEEFLEILRENNILSTYYYAYAIELDYDPDVNMPDREFVQLYFKKSLEESPLHLLRMAKFVVDGYLFPEESDSGLCLDVVHAEEMLKMLEEYLEAYHAYIIANEQSEDLQHWNDLTAKLVKGYTKIAECYSTGQAVQKSKNTAKEYSAKSQQIKTKMSGLAAKM